MGGLCPVQSAGAAISGRGRMGVFNVSHFLKLWALGCAWRGKDEEPQFSWKLTLCLTVRIPAYV